MDSSMPSTDVGSFVSHLGKSRRIVALLGAGLSASSGLPTFRGAGGYWRTHEATQLATPGAFRRDPGLVWQFYAYRRHMALQARPNRAHYALAALARARPHTFLTLSQNVDGLSQRAGQRAPDQLKLLHGSLFDVRCAGDAHACGYVRRDDFADPIVPALAVPAGCEDAGVPLRSGIPRDELPRCPACRTRLLRPGVVWFGEPLPADVVADVDAFFAAAEPVDLMLVIGTSSQVYPAAGYTELARQRGARVAVVNMDPAAGTGSLTARDWFFQGDAAQIVPDLLRSVIGDSY